MWRVGFLMKHLQDGHQFYNTLKQESSRKRTLRNFYLDFFLILLPLPLLWFLQLFDWTIWNYQYSNILTHENSSFMQFNLTDLLSPQPNTSFTSLSPIHTFLLHPPFTCTQILPPPPLGFLDNMSDSGWPVWNFSPVFNYCCASTFLWIGRPHSPPRDIRVKLVIYI